MQPAELRFVSLASENALPLYRGLTQYLSSRVGTPMRLVENQPWQTAERMLYRGEAQLGVVCGLQYVYAVDRGEVPGVYVLAAAVMLGQRYGGRPIYFSDVVVRSDSAARSLASLRGHSWADNEPTSQSGYGIVRYTLASRGLGTDLFGRLVVSGSHLRSLSLVLDGSVAASAIDSTVLEQELRLRPPLAAEIRVVDTLGPSPIPPLVISQSVPAEVRSSLLEALVGMHADPAG